MTRTLSICLLLAFAASPRAYAGDQLALGGTWRFSIDQGHQTSEAWVKPDFDSSDWATLSVPGNWDTENQYAHFKGTGRYLKQFELPKDWKDGHIRLHFGAVYQTARVWLNGEYLGEHVGGYTPFEFDVTRHIKPGRRNMLAVAANNEYNRGAWWKWGGISQPVFLVRDGELRIVRQQIAAEPDLDAGTSTVTAKLFIRNHQAAASKVRLEAQLYDANETAAVGEPVAATAQLDAKADGTATLTFALNASQTRLWGLDAPRLYRLVTRLYVDDKLLDEASDRFGIRKIETRDAKLLLNGKPVYASGFNRLATHRAYGQTEPEHLIKFDIDAMMAMGARMARIAHHPQSPALLEYCDEVGFLIIEEIPVWGKTDRQVLPDNALTKQWLTEMIERDFNHPCIIAWSVGNELAERNLSGQRMSWKVYEYVRTMLEHAATLDRTRLKTYVSNTATEANGPGVDPNDLVDILCHNSYGGSEDQVKKLHRIWPEKPVFVTELGKSQIGEPLESAIDERLRKEILALKAYDFVVGCSIWSYNDYRSHFSKTPPSENRAWGVYNVWRQPKAAAYELRELFTGGSGDGELPSLTPIPAERPADAVHIQAVVPLDASAVVGFSVLDKRDTYEVSCRPAGGSERIFPVAAVRGAVKIRDLEPGEHEFRIRRIINGEPSGWSAPYNINIESVR